MLKKSISEKLYDTAKMYMPGGVNSPVRAFKSVHGSPIFVERGDGAKLYDVDGNEYIDFCCSWGPLILGHRPPEVLSAIDEVLKKGTSFGAPTVYENDLAQLVVDNHAYIDKIRFVNSGTEAVMSAIRLARGYTNKDKVVKFEGCYHGHVDGLLVKAGSGLATFGESSSAGVPDAYAKETIVVPLNDFDGIKQVVKDYHSEIAAIIIEPIPANNGLLIQDQHFLQLLRDLCSENNIVLIFDEVISGFRVGFEGAAAMYEIVPDIFTFGKVIGGGLPVGAYAARNEIMACVSPDGPVYQAGTLSGNPLAMAAGYAQLKACLEPDFYTDLANKTNDFVDSLNDHAKSKGYPFQVFNIGSIFWLAFSKEHHINRADLIDVERIQVFKELHQYTLEHGVYLAPSGYEVGFVSRAHTVDILETASKVICSAMDKIFK